MRLSELELLQLLPTFMRQDGAAVGLSQGADQVVRQISSQLPLLRKWDQIDEMGHEMLDELAWELNVLWYSPSAPLETKRRLIKNSDMVYMRLGTRWAVEEVIQSYLGDATMQEFWQYNGKPHYFRIQSNNNQITGELEEIFLWALDIVKRKSQWLEAITIELEGHSDVFAGAVYQEAEVQNVAMGDGLIRQFVGVAVHEAAVESMSTFGGTELREGPIGLHTGTIISHSDTEQHDFKRGEAAL